MGRFSDASRMAGSVSSDFSLARDIGIMGGAGNEASFAAAKRAALEKLAALHTFVSRATFSEARDDAPKPTNRGEGCGLTAIPLFRDG
jgi:hypothetical protein